MMDLDVYGLQYAVGLACFSCCFLYLNIILSADVHEITRKTQERIAMDIKNLPVKDYDDQFVAIALSNKMDPFSKTLKM